MLLNFQPKQRQLNMTLADGFQLCEQGSDYSEAVCHPVYSFIYHSLLEQYWTLYGYGWGEEPPAATKIPNFAHSDRNYEVSNCEYLTFAFAMIYMEVISNKLW